jgi:hypothetical protein
MAKKLCKESGSLNLERTIVNFTNNLVKPPLRQIIKRRFFRKVLSDDPVGILFEAPLPGMIGIGQKNVEGESLRQVAVRLELFAVIRCWRVTRPGLGCSIQRVGPRFPALR